LPRSLNIGQSVTLRETSFTQKCLEQFWEKGRRFAGDLLKGGEQGIHVGVGEVRKAVVFEIDKQDILPAAISLRQKVLDQLIHIAGFSCPPLLIRGGKILSSSHSAITFFIISAFIVYCPLK